MSWHGVGRTAFACLLGGTLVNACHLIGGAGDLEFAADGGGGSAVTTSAPSAGGDGGGGSAATSGGGGAGGVVDPCDACEAQGLLCDDADQCVSCLDNVDCVDDPAGPTCVEGSCAPCTTTPDDCEGNPNGGVCDDGACVECSRDEQGTCSAAETCNLLERRCVGIVTNTLPRCAPCSNTLQCQGGTSGQNYCVEQLFKGAPVGHFCLPNVQGCSGGFKAPYVDSGTLVEVGTEVDRSICVMAGAANCIVHNAFLAGWECDPEISEMCGPNTMQLQPVPGAVCADFGAVNRCTYPCASVNGEDQCPRNMSITASCGLDASGTPPNVCGGS